MQEIDKVLKRMTDLNIQPDISTSNSIILLCFSLQYSISKQKKSLIRWIDLRYDPLAQD